MQDKIIEVLQISPIVPVVVIEDIKDAVPLAQSLIEGGIHIIEVTLRSSCALEAIELIAKNVPKMRVGAGTILNPTQLEQAQNRGAEFLISPGLTIKLLEYAKKKDMPLIPGVSSSSEVMQALELGYSALKFFPAEYCGGVKLLNAFNGPFKGVKFCPTGGISADNMRSYLNLENVLCVGGSWLTPKNLIQNKEWDKITEICKRSLALR
ncbi:bifunctional 4-hydroxy-2-oxoglutarate aldolase/2-dehydro-3-deoxy-phosphogluconate aldolase [Helicobacter pylori]|uniref:bifunctional 4-hydroxy-2-oxoglutarate aldolase/2-dehydro-3-deoxy-phosphogluconate aldolase n=1 Tax=Helicobacter pylori TaxID=210 RepID=UPI000EB5BD03|nr:bifunctional 4-hydroxy-2-oxoglutarate aldolase/2-dehydro-3-deoxy-phosphogluconate aldolase [Helicobacter pylori]MCK0501927.1 bifunctional 4-hydroxy-2-oxoglutarate aldolase/2-dehydro-3-deoxy-phosphogluconate aldolase [Helicobacter pylori]WJI95874.1 bifunctional 4-hydroxy-2-oxoglutarate aldolase/2-dehydro-3-deoxy-phosphogluconate aldolase [Helicobacter pylori]WQW06088.1 bifunctional 4-hydroxy-2-oxoglutarate aldolase/2-dehydro-3-deoxy-phosphogluconate aldolase [Helicobacter pylori]BDO45088.1 2-